MEAQDHPDTGDAAVTDIAAPVDETRLLREGVLPDLLQDLGVDLVENHVVGGGLSLEELLREGFRLTRQL